MQFAQLTLSLSLITALLSFFPPDLINYLISSSNLLPHHIAVEAAIS